MDTNDNIRINEVDDDLAVVENNEKVYEGDQAPAKIKYPDNPDVKSIFKAFYDPSELSRKTGKIQWFFFPLLPAFCYMLFALQLFLENVGTDVRAGNILIVPIGALCGYSFVLIGSFVMFFLLKLKKQNISFTETVAVLSGCFVAPSLVELVGTVLNIALPFPTSVNFGMFGLFAFMIPLSYFTAKNSNGKTFPIVWLTIVSVINVLIVCLMMKVGGVT